MTNILGIVGSLRKDSYNRALMNAFVKQVPEGVSIQVAEIGDLPLYDQDLEGDFPATAKALKEKIENADAIIIATPEYNRSIPGVLKNAIDWASRPYGQNSFKHKPLLVLGTSIGPTAASLAQYDLKKVMLYLDAHVVGQPEFFLGNAGEKFDAGGNLIDKDTVKHIDSALEILLNTK